MGGGVLCIPLSDKGAQLTIDETEKVLYDLKRDK